jgi:cation-transporting ATPase 13A2
MSWAGPFPELSRKRPTSDLVSRKVLTPLLGQMVICIAIQAVAFITVREQPWFKPPKLHHDKSNIRNSENTALFLTSCFEYILAGVVLNAGGPFRQKAVQNWPFVATILIALLATLYLVLGPAKWVSNLMQLTYISWDFKLEIIALGALYLTLAWVGENYVFQSAARFIGRVTESFTKTSKKRKEYKLIQERMLF